MTLDGNYSLGASGRIDTAHLELQRANWRAQPFTVGMSGSTLAEPEMIGSFEVVSIQAILVDWQLKNWLFKLIRFHSRRQIPLALRAMAHAMAPVHLLST